MAGPGPGCAKVCLTLLTFCALGLAGHPTTHPTPTHIAATPTTAHIFLPYYPEEAWLPLRGSILTANLECKAAETTTVATCSGYSSYKSGYTNGLITGPTEISWTSTLTTGVEWAVITLGEKPKATGHHLEVAASSKAAHSVVGADERSLMLLVAAVMISYGRLL
ncbi:hypothetical protein CP532_1151 [Ophiocordyceps camponoti-leonardi (nom. inval.)]|nr:hypothetical protein CP532_1151 [Ophiocordyceps camponoti-leonardi (nom. inval.)]